MEAAGKGTPFEFYLHAKFQVNMQVSEIKSESNRFNNLSISRCCCTGSGNREIDI